MLTTFAILTALCFADAPAADRQPILVDLSLRLASGDLDHKKPIELPPDPAQAPWHSPGQVPTDPPGNSSARIILRGDSLETRDYAGTQVLILYDPKVLRLTGATLIDPARWMKESGFVPDAPGINNRIDDGDAIWVGFGRPGGPYPESPADIVVFAFTRLAAGSTTIYIGRPWPPDPGIKTKVASIGGLDITGVLRDLTLP